MTDQTKDAPETTPELPPNTEMNAPITLLNNARYRKGCQLGAWNPDGLIIPPMRAQ